MAGVGLHVRRRLLPRIERKVGSIAPGNFADFTGLEADPLAVPVAAIRDIKVWGTVLGGRKFPVTDIKP